MSNKKNIKNIKTEVRGGKMWKIVTFTDGTKEEKMVSETAIDRMLNAVDKTPDLRVVQGGKSKKEGGYVTTECVNFFIAALLVVSLIMFFSGCAPEDDRRTSSGWHQYADYYGEPAE